MSLMTLKRYRNEIILFLSILFALYAFYYKFSANQYVQENKAVVQREIAEIIEIESYKKQWKSRGIANKVNVFKKIVKKAKLKHFSKKSSKVTVSYKDLTTDELNKVTNKLLNIPIEIVKLKIKESSKNRFTMEFTCKW